MVSTLKGFCFPKRDTTSEQLTSVHCNQCRNKDIYNEVQQRCEYQGCNEVIQKDSLRASREEFFRQKTNANGEAENRTRLSENNNDFNNARIKSLWNKPSE